MVKKKEEIYKDLGYVLLTDKENFNKKDKLEILCPKHGVFLKTLGDFTRLNRPSYCQECSKERIKIYKKEGFSDITKKSVL